MFGTSGIRGIYGTEITEQLAFKIANIFTSFEEYTENQKPFEFFPVARDIRKSGVSLFNSVAGGVLANQINVIDCGIVPTPTLALATKKYSSRGIMITASHNPPEYNGLKLIENSKEIDKSLEKEISSKYQNWKPNYQEGGKIFKDNQIVQQHKELIFTQLDQNTLKSVEQKKPKIIVDCNGAGAAITPSLLTDLGAKVTTIHSSLECFERPSEPNEKNLQILSNMVRSSGADFGLAQDGDGDRCVVVDEAGIVLPLDVQLAIMIEHELEKQNSSKQNRKIVSTVEASLLVREIVEQNKGQIFITPVGSTFLADKLEEENAAFGGEPCGEYVYCDGVHVPDGVLAAAKMLEIFVQKGSFSKLKQKFKQNFVYREKFSSPNKLSSIEKIKNKIKNSIEGTTRADDGLRIDEEDGWFLVRASGTEPIIRLTMEYNKKEKLQKRKTEIEEIIRKSLV